MEGSTFGRFRRLGGGTCRRIFEFRQGHSWGFRQGEHGSAGHFQRPVLNGDTINFQNIDDLRSLMTAWKKLVSTSLALRWKATDFISHSRPPRGLRELAIDDPADFAGKDSGAGCENLQ